MFRYFPFILKNTLRNRRRSILTISSIAVSLCILGVLMALYKAMFFGEPTPEQALRLITRHRVSLTQPVPIYYREQIQRIPGVRGVMAWQWFGGVYKDRRDPNNFFPRFGAEPEFFFQVYPEFQISDDEKQAFQRERTGAVISRNLADKMHFKLGDRITLVGDIFPVTLDLKVVGIFDEPAHAEILYFNRTYLKRRFSSASPHSLAISSFSSWPSLARSHLPCCWYPATPSLCLCASESAKWAF